MKDVTFNFSDKQLRTQIIDGEPYFCVYDVGKMLGLTNATRQANSYKKGVQLVHTLTKGGNQKLLYVTESNLYRLIFKSKKENAVAFQDWIFEEVIPSIRKTGKYSIPENVKQISTKNRTSLTDEWQKHGIVNSYEYVQLTLQEYKSLGFENDKRKKDFNHNEILLLSALESMEALKLFNNDVTGYYACKDSLIETSSSVNQIAGLSKKSLI